MLWDRLLTCRGARGSRRPGRNCAYRNGRAHLGQAVVRGTPVKITRGRVGHLNRRISRRQPLKPSHEGGLSATAVEYTTQKKHNQGPPTNEQTHPARGKRGVLHRRAPHVEAAQGSLPEHGIRYRQHAARADAHGRHGWVANRHVRDRAVRPLLRKGDGEKAEEGGRGGGGKGNLGVRVDHTKECLVLLVTKLANTDRFKYLLCVCVLCRSRMNYSCKRCGVRTKLLLARVSAPETHDSNRSLNGTLATSSPEHPVLRYPPIATVPVDALLVLHRCNLVLLSPGGGTLPLLQVHTKKNQVGFTVPMFSRKPF